ncbi:MAG: hypothetical protein LBN21_10535, partial [Treponema sp.]|nr:hypothetical protein [Treponema sp.]
LLHHEFYSVNFDNEYHTISFYGTNISFRSKGAWILDGDSDWGSLQSFLYGENNWEVVEIKTENGINVEKTILNIIKKIDSDVTYYYRDHIKNKPNADNCITAIRETCVEK